MIDKQNVTRYRTNQGSCGYNTIPYNSLKKLYYCIVFEIMWKNCGTVCTIGDFHTSLNFENILDKIDNFRVNLLEIHKFITIHFLIMVWKNRLTKNTFFAVWNLWNWCFSASTMHWNVNNGTSLYDSNCTIVLYLRFENSNCTIVCGTIMYFIVPKGALVFSAMISKQFEISCEEKVVKNKV